MDNIIAYLNGELSLTEKQQFEAKIASDAEFKRVFEEEKELWEMLGTVSVPEVSTNVKARFFDNLETYKEATSQPSFFAKLKELWQFQPKLKLSYAMALLAVGLTIGFVINMKSSASSNKEISQLSNEVSEMKKMMMLTLIEDPSASQRMRAVSFTSEIESVDNPVLEALFTTLNHDPNDNVRLVTLETLTSMADKPEVREGLVKSIGKQTSPLLQSAMADVMVKLQEKSSIKPLKKILKQEDLNHTVKDKIEESIQLISI